MNMKIALPIELNKDENIKLVRSFVKKILLKLECVQILLYMIKMMEIRTHILCSL